MQKNSYYINFRFTLIRHNELFVFAHILSLICSSILMKQETFSLFTFQHKHEPFQQLFIVKGFDNFDQGYQIIDRDTTNNITNT